MSTLSGHPTIRGLLAACGYVILIMAIFVSVIGILIAIPHVLLFLGASWPTWESSQRHSFCLSCSAKRTPHRIESCCQSDGTCHHGAMRFYAP